MTIKFTNNASTTLASGITNSATSLTVSSGAGALFPTIAGSDIFYVTLANTSGTVEIVKVTARSSDTFTIVRAQDNTSAVAWNTGDKVELRPTAGVLNAFVQQDPAAPSTFGFKNRIINGAMMIDQRNAGASVTTPTTSSFIYTLDRWNYYVTQGSKFTVQQNAGSVTPPIGFSNYLGVTSTSAYSVVSGDLFSLNQPIEGFNTADLAWGTANAKTVTLSFWVYSSLTGTFGGSILNNAYNRSYPFTYTVSSANTWTQISITIAGDTTGTWVGATNGVGLRINFSLGTGSTYSGTAGSWSGSQYWSATGATSVVGTSGATFYITGVQLEKGSTATSFDYRPYGTELMLCQRYYEQSYDIGTVAGTASTNASANYVYVSGPTGFTGGAFGISFKVTKRAIPTLTAYSPTTGASGKMYSFANASDYSVTLSGQQGTNSFGIYWAQASSNNVNGAVQWTAYSEL